MASALINKKQQANSMNLIFSYLRFPAGLLTSIYLLFCTATALAESLFIISLIPIFNNGGNMPISADWLISIIDYFQDLSGSLWIAPIILSVIMALLRFLTFNLGLQIGVKATNYLSKNIVDLYLNQPYKIYQAYRGSNIQSLFAFVDIVESSVVKNIIASASNFITVVIILLNLVYLSDLKLLLSISAAAIFYVLFVGITSKRVERLSLRKADNKKGIIRIIDEFDMNYKSIRVETMQNNRLHDFCRKENKYRASGAEITLLSQTPKFVVESLTITFVFGYALFKINQTPQIEITVLSTQITILFAGLRRIIPSMQQISNTVVTIKGTLSNSCTQ